MKVKFSWSANIRNNDVNSIEKEMDFVPRVGDHISIDVKVGKEKNERVEKYGIVHSVTHHIGTYENTIHIILNA